MLARVRTESESVGEKAVLLGRTKAVSKRCFCPNSACLADEVSVRAASSYSGVWLVTDEEIDSSWLMMAAKPSCPHCGATLVAIENERAEMVLPLM
jgi:hypothetical protein